MPGLEVAFARMDFEEFCREVQNEWRYVHSGQTKKFLDTVEATLSNRILPVEKDDDSLWRAQVGCDWESEPDDENDIPNSPVPYKEERMKPLPQSYGAREGRVNPSGIPCLYLATTRYAALCEVRPTPGAFVTVAKFKILRNLKIVDCGRSVGRPINYLRDNAEETMWTAIDNAFSKPTTGRDHVGEYVPTQILAELFRSKGCDGIAYRSIFSKPGTDPAYNLALFNADDAECEKTELVYVKSVTIET